MSIFLASPNVVFGKPINAIVFKDDFWVILNSDDIEISEKLTLNDFEVYEEENLYQRIPALKGKLDSEKETFVYIDEKTGELNVNPKHKHLGFSTADMARATNQANVEISILKYLRNRKRYILKLSLAIIFVLILCLKISWFFLFYLIRILFLHIFSVLNQRNMCLSGTLNAAIVLSVKPTKIAVLTDMGMFGGNYPIIRIKNVELPTKFNIKDKRIPVAGSYQNVENQPFWDFFDPIPLPLGAKNEDVIKKKINEIPVYDWITLNKHIKMFNELPREGYYPIDIENTSWKNIDNPRFSQFNEES